MAVQQDGWASLANMGNALYQVDLGFDPRTYGHKQLSKIISKLKDRFEMKTQENDGPAVFYVKMKEYINLSPSNPLFWGAMRRRP